LTEFKVGAAQPEKTPTNGFSIFVLLLGVCGVLGCGKDKNHPKTEKKCTGGHSLGPQSSVFLITPGIMLDYVHI